MTSVSDPVPITRSLDSIMKSLRGTDRIQIGGVFGRWDDAVGPAVAAHVRPVRLDQGVLTVEADSLMITDLLGSICRARRYLLP